MMYSDIDTGVRIQFCKTIKCSKLRCFWESASIVTFILQTLLYLEQQHLKWLRRLQIIFLIHSGLPLALRKWKLSISHLLFQSKLEEPGQNHQFTIFQLLRSKYVKASTYLGSKVYLLVTINWIVKATNTFDKLYHCLWNERIINLDTRNPSI